MGETRETGGDKRDRGDMGETRARGGDKRD